MSGDDPLWRRAETGWVPADEEAQELFSAFKLGEVCRFKPRKMRNEGHHRKFFALIKMVVQNSDGWTVESLREYVAIECGWFTAFTFPAQPGFVFRKAKSISWGKMDQTQFDVFFNKAIDVLIKNVVPHISAKELRDAVEMNLAVA
jgi:hypothetical protein